MGSRGSGRFSDYTGTIAKNADSAGGASGVDRCKQAFTCSLEDVAQSAYFSKNQSTPPSGSNLQIVLQARLFAVDAKSGLIVGALPTSFNYLAACITSGINYLGVITVSANTPVPNISADFIAK